MEVEKKGGGSFPSNYVTIHQLRQRWLQQQQSSSSLSLSPVIYESSHRDDDDDVESSKKPQNDAVSGHSPPPAVTKTPSYNNKNKASSSSSNPNQQPPLSPISSSSGGGSKKKPQNDAVSPPPAKTKSPPSYNNNNNNNKPPPQQNHHNEIVSKTPLNETRFRKGCNPNRLLTPQKPKPEPEPEPTDNVVVNDVTDQPISIDNKNQLSKKIKYKKTRNPKRVLPDQTLTGAGSLPQTDPKPELEAVVDKEQESRELLGGRRKSNKKKAVRESKMAPELEQVVVVEKKQQLRESRGRRDWDKKGVREFKDKTASSGQNKHAVVVGDNVVEPELEVEMEVEAVVVEKRQKPRETRGRRDWDNKAVREFKPKTASFGQYDYNSNVDTNDDVGGGGVEADKVVGDGDGDVVKEKNSRRGSGKFDHQGRGKQSLKAAPFDHDQDMSLTAVKESDAVNNNNNNINATSDGGSNWRKGSGRFSGQGIRRPLNSKPLIAMTKGKVWVKKGESTTPN